jgi:hypothetical protein
VSGFLNIGFPFEQILSSNVHAFGVLEARVIGTLLIVSSIAAEDGFEEHFSGCHPQFSSRGIILPSAQIRASMVHILGFTIVGKPRFGFVSGFVSVRTPSFFVVLTPVT